MVDAEHDHGVLFLVDLVDHPVGAASRKMKAGEFSLEAPADAVRVLDERCHHELDDCGRGALW